MVLDVLVQSRRDKRAAKRLLRKLLKRQCRARAIRFSENVVADIREWTSTWGRRALDFGGRAGYHDFNQI